MKRKSPRRSMALIIRPASLPPATRALIQVPTPSEFIKTRPGKGTKTFTYVEGGYVIARLNQIFSPVGWDFDVVNERVEANEVVVRGKLTIKDHKNGYTISKTQYGTKTRYAEVPLGDTLKAAATDCLKKCASLFGVALDVYWQQLDEDKLINGGGKEKVVKSKIDKPTKKQLMALSLKKIEVEEDPTILAEIRVRVQSASIYDDNEKKVLINAINKQLKKNAGIESGQKGLF